MGIGMVELGQRGGDMRRWKGEGGEGEDGEGDGEVGRGDRAGKRGEL